MNTYDFDKTIYVNDSSVDFFLFCLRKHPGAVLRALPDISVKGIKYFFGKCGFHELKECAFSYLNYIPDVTGTVEQFWKENWNGIGQWYLKQKRDDDVIISASPEFIVYPVGEKLGVEVIATKMNKKTGKLLGRNCHDHEKVRRFLEKHPKAKTENFYSDSDNDTPMARFAEKAFKVERGKIRPWKFAE